MLNHDDCLTHAMFVASESYSGSLYEIGLMPGLPSGGGMVNCIEVISGSGAGALSTYDNSASFGG